MTRVFLIALAEWRLMYRSKVTLLALCMLAALTIVAALTSIAHRNESDALRLRFQQQANTAFDDAPARHPHRMVHYGHFVFRPLSTLAAFDSGVDAFTGHAMYLEGHRQNSANFGDVRQSSLLVRFGQLTPAFVLQVLAPLVLIFIGFGNVARERERGSLRQLLAHGASARTLLLGKLFVLTWVAALMLVPAAFALLWLVIAQGASLLLAALLLLGCGLYLLVWCALITAISSFVSTARSSQIALLVVWVTTVVFAPRLATEGALATYPSLSKVETNIAVQEELRKIGDSHDPNDPHFNQFKANTLAKYGVQRIEDLPVNYRGLLAVEGERLESQLFDAYAEREHAAHQKQNRISDLVALLSPSMAIKRMSMSIADTNLASHRRFLMQAEAYRFSLVQHLNGLQATALTYSDDSNRNKDADAAKRVRISPNHWHEIPDFQYRPTQSRELLRASLPGLLTLIAWLIAIGYVLNFASRRLGETT